MKDKVPSTNAIRYLNEKKVVYTPMFYKYVEHGGTKVSSKELGVDEHKVIKTLIMENDKKEYFIVLMHGDMEVSVKNLARYMNTKTVHPCTPEVANRQSGYLVGGTSPFGTRMKMKVYIEKTILDLDKIYINGGRKGMLVELNPKILPKILDSELVEVGIR